MAEPGGVYWRPLLSSGPEIAPDAHILAGGWTHFSHVERLERGQSPQVLSAHDAPADVLERLCAPRDPICGLAWERPHLMGILNVTPDSFSDGGRFDGAAAAASSARAMADDVSMIDIGGESTRPGATPVSVDEEISRTVPVLEALTELDVAKSIDTRNAVTARAALAAGAGLVNDVSAMTHDPGMAAAVAESGAPVCLMHAQGDPQTMQDAPRYEDVVLDVYDQLAARVQAAAAAGIPRARILVDPGIGFGKTLAHNLALLQRLSLFHGLGCAVLLGASRKRFIGTIGQAPEAQDRAPGSIAVALHGVTQGVQLLRVHDTAATAQALRLACALHT